ncbi:MAG: Ig-like domain-containing protein, partial [Acidimicrobiales bacterium]
MLLVLGASANAQTNGEETVISFETVSLPDSTQMSGQVTELIEAGGDNRFVAFNAADLMDDLQAADTVNLELFPNMSFPLTVTGSREGVAGSRFWTAEGRGVSASFTELNGVINGRIVDLRNTVYRIVHVDGQVHFVTEDRIEYPGDIEADPPELDDADGDASNADVIAGDTAQIDVLAWYDSGAISIFGSSQNAEAAIAMAYNTGTTAAMASGADLLFNVVELKFVDWTPPAGAVDAITAIRSQTDGTLDQVHAARDAVGADLVAIIGDMNGGCGIAYVPNSAPGPGTSSLGFSYTDAACVGGNLTLVHETAHNLGASHDIGASQPGPGLFSYSQGYVNPVLGYRTIMSYTTACSGCLRVPFFSNPTGNYNGNPVGDAGKDNGRTLNETAAGVASYRSGGDTVDPNGTIASPSAGSNVTGNPIALSGTATDNIGVDRVRLTIYETTGYTTWNGTAFTPAFSTVDANLASPGATSTGWSYNMASPPDGRVVFTAVAFDAAENFDATQPWRLFNIANDSVAPDATIANPTSGQDVDGSPILDGAATDNAGISRVRLTIYETDGFMTWNGSAFTAPFTTVDATLSANGTGADWSYTMSSPPETQVVFTALAYDTAGNLDPVKPWRLFDIVGSADNVAPNGTIDNPTQNESVGAATVVLDGTATDNIGVTRVRLTIYDTANNNTWDGSAFTAAFSTVEATVTPNGSNAAWSYDMVNPPGETQVVFTAL